MTIPDRSSRRAHAVRASVAALVLASSLVPVGRASAAPEKQACLDAYEQTQKLRKEGKLLAAKKKSLVCAQDGCPAMVRDDCTSWSVEIEKSTPTIVLEITDASGRDLTDATVLLDDEPVTAHVEGKAVALDPGTHKLRVERAGSEPVEQDVVAHEGEKNRKVSIVLGGGEVAKGPEGGEPAGDTGPKERPVPAATWIFGAIGVAGLATFGAFALSGNAKKDDLDARACKPACPQADVDAAKQSYLIADVGLGVAVVGLGLAAVFYATRGEETTPKAGAIPRVDVAVSHTYGGATLGWSF